MITESRFDFDLGNDRSISDRVCETIRKAILINILKPNERLVESKIAKELNVSITPVRYAFAQLAKEGLISVFPFKGTYVTQLNAIFCDEVGNIRVILESEAAKFAYDNLTKKDIVKLKTLCQEMEDAFFIRKNLYESILLDVSFHEIIFERSGNSLMFEIWLLLKPRIQLVQSYAKSDTVSKGRMYKRHMEIVNVLEKGSKEDFVHIVVEHLLSGIIMTKNAILENRT